MEQFGRNRGKAAGGFICLLGAKIALVLLGVSLIAALLLSEHGLLHSPETEFETELGASDNHFSFHALDSASEVA